MKKIAAEVLKVAKHAYNKINYSKAGDVLSLALSPSAILIGFFFFEVTPLIDAKEDDPVYFTLMISVVFVGINYIQINMALPFLRFTRSNDVRIYIETAVIVVISYVSLLGVDWSYIWLAAFPVIAIGFIFALSNELTRQSGSQQHSNDECSGHGVVQEGGRETKKAEGQKAAALVPYWVHCFMRPFHIFADYLVISRFLLFFSSMLGALTLMMTRLALTRAAPGVAPASVLLRKASLVVHLVMFHTVAAELLGENIVLFILPELAPVLLWFSIHLDSRDGSYITADKIKSHRNVTTVFGAVLAVVLALLAASMDEFVFAWCIKALVSCFVSGILVYQVVSMLYQWPGLDSTAAAIVEEAVMLLKLWGNTLLIAAIALLVFTFLAADRLGLLEQMVAEPSKFFSDYVIRSSIS